MKYQAYPEYKDSGVEWVGQYPEHWVFSTLDKMIDPIRRVTYGIVQPGEPDSNGRCMVRGQDYSNGWCDKESIFKVSDKVEVPYKRARLDTGDVILTIVRAGVGNTEVVPPWLRGANITQTTARLAPYKNKSLSTFIRYLFDSYMGKANVDLSSKGAAQPGLNLAHVAKYRFCFPSYEEQTQIANFLDHETVKIDTLVEKQQQLIKLLKEKRQAVISHAVTKGLNPNAPMRDSGVEWLGEVPEHWDICLIKHKCHEITDGAHVSPVTEGGERYFVSITDVKKGIINFDDALLTTSESFEYLVKTGCMPFSGDILFSKDGTIGQTAITPDDIEFVVASSLIIIRPNKGKVIPHYLDFLLQSAVVVEQVESFVKGAALRRLSIQNLLKVGGVFPPIAEQEVICSYLIKILDRYDDLEARANDLIKLQQERRTALISAAVTGKIDVRNWQPSHD